MNRISRFAGGLACVLLLAAPAIASDTDHSLGIYDWSGPYFGLKAGGGFGDSNSTAPAVAAATGDYDIDGFIGGFMSGYNLQSGRFVFGIDSDTSFTDINGSSPIGAMGAVTTTEIEWLSTTRGRIGYDMGGFMPYVTGGIAYGNVNVSVAGVGSDDNFYIGYAVGGGGEWVFAEGWHARVEYLYADLGSDAVTLGGTTFNTDIKELHLVRAGVSMKIGWIWDSIFGR